MAGLAKLDLESLEAYGLDNSVSMNLDLESTETYLKRVKATIRLHRARAANIVAYILVSGTVGALPLYALLAIVLSLLGEPVDTIVSVFGKWFDVIGPLLGASVGALFGLSISARRDNATED